MKFLKHIALVTAVVFGAISFFVMQKVDKVELNEPCVVFEKIKENGRYGPQYILACRNPSGEVKTPNVILSLFLDINVGDTIAIESSNDAEIRHELRQRGVIASIACALFLSGWFLSIL